MVLHFLTEVVFMSFLFADISSKIKMKFERTEAGTKFEKEHLWEWQTLPWEDNTVSFSFWLLIFVNKPQKPWFFILESTTLG